MGHAGRDWQLGAAGGGECSSVGCREAPVVHVQFAGRELGRRKKFLEREHSGESSEISSWQKAEETIWLPWTGGDRGWEPWMDSRVMVGRASREGEKS